MAANATTGKVYLVGAGPGDPGLITVEGLRRLRQADVVVFDALANATLLDEARPDAELIDCGKRGGDHKLTQDQTNDLLVELAKQGLDVVRLKGGDPYLFGRGAEEAAYLARHGVECMVIPGVTSGIAAPAMAGIPVTHRGYASTVTFVTGHEAADKDDEANLDFEALARMISSGGGGTVCFYMGAGRLPQIAARLIDAGLSPRTPAAMVQWGTQPRQRQVRATIADLADVAKEAGVGSPAIIVVGAVAGIDEPGLDFFIRRPLFGRRIIVTRSRQQASDLSQQLTALGAEVLEAPTIELVPPQDWATFDEALRQLQTDWLVLTSVNGVSALSQRLEVLGLDARHLAKVKIAVIGESTGEALRAQLGLRADLMPSRFVAESLAEELIANHDVAGKRFLLLRADIARPALVTLLEEAGAVVNEVTAYQTKIAAALPQPVLDALGEGRVDWITFTSSSTAANLVQLLGGPGNLQLLRGVRLASIGPITSQTMRDCGLTVTVEARRHTIPGLVAALAGFDQSGRSS